MIRPVALFKALGDETRIRILNLLLRHELNVNELVHILEMGQSRISRHLKILSDCGLVSSRRDGLWVFYAAETEGREAAFLVTVQDILEEEPHRGRDAGRSEGLQKENREAVTHFFDEIAPEWDSMQKEVFGSFDPGRFIMEQVPKCRVAADLGCGTGSLFPGLLEKAARVIGVDSSGNMIETARKNFSDTMDRIDFRLGEMAHLPLKDNEADCAVINMVLHHLPSIEQSLAETFRILSDGGTIVIMDFRKHHEESFRNRFQDRRLGFDLEELRSSLEKTGFTISGEKTRGIKPDLDIVLLTARK